MSRTLTSNQKAQCHSFHSSVLYLEQQDLGLDKGPQVNSKNQNIKELTSLSKHHQGMVRKEAYIGLKDLIDCCPRMLKSSLSELMGLASSGLIDGDKMVRESSRSLAAAIITQVEPELMKPFAPILIAYTKNCMTHLEEKMRRDGLACLGVWVDILPEAVSKSSSTILPALLSLMSTQKRTAQSGSGGTVTSRIMDSNPSGQMNSVAMRAEAMVLLHKFVKLCFVAEGKKSDFPTQIEYDCVQWTDDRLYALAQPKIQIVELFPEHEPTPSLTEMFPADGGECRTAKSFSEVSMAMGGNTTAAELLDGLYKVVIDSWLECQPSDPSSPESYHCMAASLRVLEHLVSVVSRTPEQWTSKKEQWRYLTAHVLPYFPFKIAPHFSGSDMVVKGVHSINISVASMYEKFRAADLPMPTSLTKSVFFYMEDLFKNKEVYRGLPLLPIYEGFTRSSLPDSITQAFMGWAARLSPGSMPHRTALDVMSRLVLSKSTLSEDTQFQMVVELAKSLWKADSTADTVVPTLFKLVSQTERSSPLLSKIDPLLVPLFFKSFGTPPKEVFGPFKKISKELQYDLVLTVNSLPCVSQQLANSLRRCTELPNVPPYVKVMMNTAADKSK